MDQRNCWGSWGEAGIPEDDMGPTTAAAQGLRRALILDHHSVKRLTDSYKLEKVIGKGSFGVVRKAHLKDCSGISRAIKEVQKMDVRSSIVIRREASILARLDHPSLCRIFETFEDERNIYLVMEFIEGRELFDEVLENHKNDHFDEPRYAAIMGQVFGALHYLHGHEVLHRDLKPENIMVQPSKEASRPHIKIIDFGLAVLTQPAKGHHSKQMEGTAAYLAPEAAVDWNFSAASDMYSTGVIIYVMFVGRFPDVIMVHHSLDAVHSENARKLLQGLLHMNPGKRPSAADAMRHPWLLQSSSASNSKQQGNIRKSVQSFVEFYQSDKLQKAALTAVASQITGEQIDALREQFHLIDKDCNGVITKDELVQAFEAAPPNHVKDIRAWAEAVYEELDSDGSGEIEFTEWEAAALRSFTEISDSAMMAAFRTIDVDDTGSINLDNLSRLIQVDSEELKDIMAGADLNGDGVIDFEEFKAVFSTVARRVSPPKVLVQAPTSESLSSPRSPRSPLGTPAVAPTAWVKRSPSLVTPRFAMDNPSSANRVVGGG